MKFTITAKQLDLTDDLRQYAEKKVGKIDRLFRSESEAFVTFSRERGRYTAEVTLKNNGMFYRVSDTTSDVFASVDSACASIERQIRKNKTRLEKKLKSGPIDWNEYAPAGAAEEEPEEAEETAPAEKASEETEEPAPAEEAPEETEEPAPAAEAPAPAENKTQENIEFFSMPEEGKEEAAENEGEESVFNIDTDLMRQPRRKAKVFALIVYILFAIPLTLAAIVILLVPAVLFLALSVASIICGVVVVSTALNGFAVIADIMVVLGMALVLFALGLLFLWTAIWFIGGAIVGVVHGVAALCDKWCYKEVLD